MTQITFFCCNSLTFLLFSYYSNTVWFFNNLNLIIIPYKINEKILLYIVFVNHIFGQINIHKNITTEDGLVNGQVSAILQDSKGYIWFGTYNGVSRWDGKNFKNIQTHNGMLSAAILDIKESKDGKIFFANYQGGVIVYDNGILDTLNENNGLLNNAATSIAVLKNGDILLCSYGNKITKLRNGKLSNWSKEVGFPDDKYFTVRDVYEEKDGTLYFATQNGLVIYKNGTFKIMTQKDGLNNDLLFGVIGNGNGTIYVSTYKGINKIENGIVYNLTKNTRFQNSFCNKIILTRNGTMYAATAHGIVSEKDGMLKEFTEKSGLAYNHCFSVYEDNNGMIYFGTNGKGFNIYNPSEIIINFNKITGLPNESIWSILKSSDNTLYFGSVNGLIQMSNNSGKLLPEKLLSNNFIRVLKEGNDGNILIGTTEGFKILNKNKIRNFSLENNLGITQVYSVLQLRNGDIYLGMQTGVVILRNGEVLKEESKKITDAINSGLNAAPIYSISESDSGALIFGSHSGLAIYRNKKFKFFTTKNGLVDNSANTTHTNSKGYIFAGTLKGINVIKNGEIIDTIDVNDGLSDNSIADIEEDKYGRIFIATYHGLNTLTDYPDSLKIRKLYAKDGLVGEDFTHESSFIDDKGNLWLGTLNGVSKYNTNADKPIKIPPRIYLSGLQLYNKDISLSKFKQESVFNYNQNYLKFYFTGINLPAPEKILYKYKLSGVDKDWVTSKNTNVQYTNLDNGNYTFEVNAGNEWGYWSKPVKLAFVINPAWWETWWFYSMSFLLITGIITFIASYRYRYLLAVEKVRTKISTDLHDSIGSGLTEISFLSEAVKSVSRDNTKAIEGLNTISVVSTRLINNMQDIVWLVNPFKDTLKDLFYRLKDSYQEMLKHSDINLKIKNIKQLEEIRLPLTFRQHVYLIFKEAINNSIKYSKCKNIAIDIKANKRKLNITLTDDGIGFDLNKVKRGNGLKNMQNRAKIINAKLEFKSQFNKGSTIIFEGSFNKLKIMEVY